MIKGKRGIMLTLRHLGLLLAVAIYILFLFQIKSIVASPYVADSLFLARNSAKMVDTMLAIPTNVHFENPFSSNGRIINVADGKIFVLKDYDEMEEDLSLQVSFFQPSRIFTVNYSSEIDASLFSINKEENEIYFVSGIDAKRALKPKNYDNLQVSTFKKTDTPIHIILEADKVEKTKFEYFQLALEDNLKELGFNVSDTEEKARLLIIIQTTKSNESNVFYTQQNSFETKGLADNILKVIPDELYVSESTLQSSEVTTKGAIYLQLGVKAQDFFSKDENKRYAARFIAIAMSKYYE